MVTARAAVVCAVLALVAFAAVHVLKRDLDASRTLISRYALGPYGWLMAACFAAWATASALVSLAFVLWFSSSLNPVGQSLLAIASLAFALAAVFPMDPVGTPRDERSLSGRMHDIAFFSGLPAFVLAVTLLSVPLQHVGFYVPGGAFLGVAIWLSFIAMTALRKKVDHNHGPDPRVPRLLGWSNRLLMISCTVWLILVAWPMAR